MADYVRLGLEKTGLVPPLARFSELCARKPKFSGPSLTQAHNLKLVEARSPKILGSFQL